MNNHSAWGDMEPLENQQSFFPRGAIASFALMLVFYAALWLMLYLVMTARG